MHILVQPRVAGKLYADRDLNDQGFLTRFLTTMPDTTDGNRQYIPRGDYHDLRKFTDRTKALLARPFTYLDPDRPLEGLCPRVLRLDERATNLWIDYHNRVDTDATAGGRWFPIRGSARKAPEHAARLAATIAVFDDPDIEAVGPEPMRAGISLMDFYLAETVRIREGLVVNEDLLKAEELRVWLLSRWQEPNDLISLRHLYQLGPHAIRDKATAEKMVSILVGHGWLEPQGPCEVKGEHRRNVWRIVRSEDHHCAGDQA
jgi:hypothetical protein